MENYKIISCDTELRRAPDGKKLGYLKLGEIVQCSDQWQNGWRQVTESSRGPGWYPIAYMQPVGETPEDPEPPIDSILSLTLTTLYESGATTTETFLPV